VRRFQLWKMRKAIAKVPRKDKHSIRNVTPEGVLRPAMCNARATRVGTSSELKVAPPQTKIHVTSKFPVGNISVVTLIRTDTTLDHSQKAEKVWPD
jgi:hypothetical protein